MVKDMMRQVSYMEVSNMRKVLIFIRLVIFFTIMFALIIVLGKVFTPKWKMVHCLKWMAKIIQ